MNVWNVVVSLQRIRVVKFTMDNGGSNGVCNFKIEIWTDTANFIDVVIARSRKMQSSSKIKAKESSSSSSSMSLVVRSLQTRTTAHYIVIKR